jgi:hypothetical protein
VLKQRGESGSFKISPLFFTPGDAKPMSKIRMELAGNTGFLAITTKHPKNLEVLVSFDTASDCSRVTASGQK